MDIDRSIVDKFNKEELITKSNKEEYETNLKYVLSNLRSELADSYKLIKKVASIRFDIMSMTTTVEEGYEEAHKSIDPIVKEIKDSLVNNVKTEVLDSIRGILYNEVVNLSDLESLKPIINNNREILEATLKYMTEKKKRIIDIFDEISNRMISEAIEKGSFKGYPTNLINKYDNQQFAKLDLLIPESEKKNFLTMKELIQIDKERSKKGIATLTKINENYSKIGTISKEKPSIVRNISLALLYFFTAGTLTLVLTSPIWITIIAILHNKIEEEKKTLTKEEKKKYF